MDATCNGAPGAAKSVDFFTSHEGPSEQCARCEAFVPTAGDSVPSVS